MPRGGMVYWSDEDLLTAMTAIRECTSPWRVSALWKERGAYFYRLRPGGTVRLYRVGVSFGFCWADLKMDAAEGGGSVMVVRTVATAGARPVMWGLCALCLLLGVSDGRQYGAGAMLARDWPYFLLCTLAALLTVAVSGETSKLLAFLEDELGWNRDES